MSGGCTVHLDLVRQIRRVPQCFLSHKNSCTWTCAPCLTYLGKLSIPRIIFTLSNMIIVLSGERRWSGDKRRESESTERHTVESFTSQNMTSLILHFGKMLLHGSRTEIILWNDLCSAAWLSSGQLLSRSRTRLPYSKIFAFKTVFPVFILSISV